MEPRRTRVLCVDDNRDVADSEAMLLDLCGFEALACYSGPEALRAFPAFGPDACLLGLNLPAMDGCELAEQLRARYNGPPRLLVAVTARGGAEDVRRTRDAGFDEHLVKPVDPQRLVKLLAGHASHPG